MKNIWRQINIADAMTLANAVCGFMSMIYAMNNYFGLASFFLIIAVVLDFLDGKVARYFKIKSDFGKELDSLADIVSFGVAPAMFTIMYYKTDISLVAGLFLLIAGCLRLARFSTKKPSKTFTGVPITVNGIIIPLLFIIKMPGMVYPIVLIIMGFLMTSSLKIKKVM